MNLETYLSKLVEKRIEKPKFRESFDEKELFLQEEFPGSFSFTLDKSNYHRDIHLFGIIDRNTMPPVFRALKYSTEQSGEDLAFLDAFTELCYDADSMRLRDLSTREIDSFLRDGTSAMAFTSQNKFIPLFDALKRNLEEALEGNSLRNKGEKASPTIAENYQKTEMMIFDPKERGSFIDLSFEDKMDVLHNIIATHIAKPLGFDGGGLEVVFVDGELIVVQYLGACTMCFKALTSTMDYVQRVFQLETQVDSLRVVTDS